mgnify:CR=1 FL=1
MQRSTFKVLFYVIRHVAKHAAHLRHDDHAFAGNGDRNDQQAAGT